MTDTGKRPRFAGLPGSWHLPVAIILSIIIFIFDVSTPTGYVVGFLQVLPLLLVLQIRNRSMYLWSAVALSLLIIAAPFVKPKLVPMYFVYFNRALMLVVFWLTAFLVQQRTRSEEALAASEKKYRELEQFAYIASHDLQEPLRMVASFTELLEQKYKEKLDDTGREFMGYVVEGATRMQRLIQDLLTFSRVGRLDTERYEIDMNILIDRVKANLSQSIRETHAEIQHGLLPTIVANETAMMQLFQNLIGNAIKFRRENTPPIVRVDVKRQGHEWLFSVKDNGIGIAPKYFDKIFLIFQRLHGRDKYPGTGMGVAIVKKIIDSYNGRIWIESKPGEGTTFHFTLPAAERAELKAIAAAGGK